MSYFLKEGDPGKDLPDGTLAIYHCTHILSTRRVAPKVIKTISWGTASCWQEVENSVNKWGGTFGQLEILTESDDGSDLVVW